MAFNGENEQTTSEPFRFNFSNDPKLREVRKKILRAKGNVLKPSESPKCTMMATSSGEFYSSDKMHMKKQNNPDGVTGFATDFRSASGQPVVKDFLPVCKVDDCDQNRGSCYQENSLSSSKIRKRLGCKPASFSAPKIFAKCDSDGREQERKVNENENDKKKRDGWKADEMLKLFEDNIIDLIEAEIMSKRVNIEWSDVAGLESTKRALREIIILPFLRPDIFTGIRAPPKGVLLFGPPGTGKTMIGRCVAAQCKATFFNIAASSITSKWVGDGEKVVRALFVIAKILQPSVIFIDEIDSLLTSRSEKEHESSRRIKTEFLIHLDGVATTSDERILILGATNRPQELDDAVKRRFAKRLYIDLPCEAARAQIIRSLIGDQKHLISDSEISEISRLTTGYSGADVKQLCAEAAMEPVRSIVDSSSVDIASVKADDIRPIVYSDFENAIRFVRPTVVEQDLDNYRQWNKQYGSLADH